MGSAGGADGAAVGALAVTVGRGGLPAAGTIVRAPGTSISAPGLVLVIAPPAPRFRAELRHGPKVALEPRRPGNAGTGHDRMPAVPLAAGQTKSWAGLTATALDSSTATLR